MRKRSVLRAEEALADTLLVDPNQDACRLRQMTKKGAWMVVQTSTVNGTELGAQEWRYALFLRYGLDPPDVPKFYDSCSAAFSICHALGCKKGGLVTAHHNELRDGVADLAGKPLCPRTCATTPSSLQVTPCKVQSLSRMVSHPPHIKKEARGHGIDGRPSDP